MRSNRFRKPISVFLSLLMLLTTLAVGIVPLRASAAIDNSTLIGRYFSTDNVWYDAAKGANGIQWQAGDYPAYNNNLGMTYFNGMYVRIDNNTLFQNVTRDTGVTFAFNYRPNFTGDHRHILSLGQNAYGNGTENQFFISGATSWYSSGRFPVVAWMNGGSETIKAYPADVSPVLGHDYNIVVVVDKDAGVVFYIDGEKKNTVYVDSDLNGQLGNIRGFLDAVHNYGENYIGCSRWTADAKIEGYLSDVRIYKTAATETEAYGLVADMAGSSFNLAQPSFNATAYHYSDPANGAYANLAYSAPATNEDSGMGIRGADNSSDYKDIEAVYFKFFTPLNVVMVYDGAHETYASIELETKRHDKANVQDQRIYYVISNSSLLKTRHNWYGYLDSAWTTWAGAYTANQINTDLNLDVYVGSTNDTPRFWWNAIKYTGTGNNDTYYDHEQNISFTLQAFFDYTIGGTSKGTGTITTLSNYYVLNYKPVYDVLNAAAAKFNNEMAGKAWMYTEASYAKAMLAMRRLALCNPNLYDYGTRGVDAAAVMCAAAIKQAKADYDAINLVKKTATVHIAPGAGAAITVTHNGTAVNDGDTIEYGETLSASASALDAYDQSTPVLAITGGSVSGSTTMVNEPDIYISSSDLSLNTYTLTFDPNGGTLVGNENSVTATYTEPLPAAIQATRDGYTFERYAYNSGSADYTYYDENYTAQGNYDVKGNVTVVAQWSPIAYSITFVPNGCTIDSSALTNFGGTYNIEDTKTLPTATAPTGYHFDGWTVSSAGSHGWGTDKIEQNASVEGKWGEVTLTATYAPNTDTAYTVEYYEMGTDGAYPAVATRTVSGSGTTGETASADTTAPTGFTFDSANVNNVLSGTIAADGSTVLKVYLSRNQYTVSVALGEGAALNIANGAQYYYGEEITLNATALTGYDPAGIAITVDGASVANGASVTVEDDIAIVVADLSKQQITVTVNAGVGTTITGAASGEYEYGTSLTVSAEANEGYNAAGLKLRVAGNVVTAPYTFTVTEAVTISTDDLNKIRLTVTANAGEGTVITGAGTYDWGDSVTVSAAEDNGYGGDITMRVNGETVDNPYTFTITANTMVETDAIHPLVHVIFQDYDNTFLTDDYVVYGGTAEGPAMADVIGSDGHTYAFIGWDQPLENITVTTVFIAQYAITHDYSVYNYNAEGHWRACSICGLPDETSGAAHALTEVTETAGTCQTEGTAHYRCETCGYVSDSFSTGLNMGNHISEADVPAQPGNCCTEGHAAGRACTACGTVVSGCESTGFDTSVAGHSYGQYVTNGDGTHNKICTREGCTAEKPNHSVEEACTADSATSATCSEKQKCALCGGEVGDYAPTNHNGSLSLVSAKSATCTEPGNIAHYYCSACHNYYSDEDGTVQIDVQNVIIPATGHAWEFVAWAWDDTTIPPTASASFVCNNDHAHDNTFAATVTEVSSTSANCGESGSVTYSASITLDGNVYTMEEADYLTMTTDALPHLWTVQSWVWNEDYSAVTLNLICERCHSTHTLPDDDNAIVIEEIPVYPADCVTDRVSVFAASAGYESYSFSTETDAITVPDSALGHSYEFTGWSWAADHASASAGFRCTRPGCTHTTAIIDNTIDVTTVQAADCGHDQTVKYTASIILVLNKGEEATVFTDTTDVITLENTKTDHVWGTTVYEWNADYTAVTATRVCTNYAAHTETETVSAVYEEVTAPDCTHDGIGKYTSAAFQNPDFSVQTYTVTLTQLGHAFTVEAATDTYLKTAATCTVPAVYYKSCARCGAASTTDTFKSGDPLGHDFVWTETTHPTCTTAGQETGVCSRCGGTDTRSVDPLGHDFGEWTETTAPTCTTAGEERRDCSRCDAFETRVAPALGHDWGEWTVVTAPDYGVPGQDKRVCARCGETEYRTTVLTSDADKFVKFTTVAKMKYVLDVGGGFVFDNTNTFYWYSAKALTFRINIASGADYDSLTVYLNGSELSPNADGSYTIPAHPGNDTITVVPVSATPSGGSGSGSGACPYCGQTHANNLWGRIVALFHTILAFFRNLFRR